jgi:hypothetical protein
VAAIAETYDQGGNGQQQEADGPADLAVAHPYVRAQGAGEVNDKADRSGRAENWHSDADD